MSMNEAENGHYILPWKLNTMAVKFYLLTVNGHGLCVQNVNVNVI